MISGKARFQSAAPKQNACANYSACERVGRASAVNNSPADQRRTNVCSLLSTEGIKAKIRVPVYERLSSARILEGGNRLLSELEGGSSLDPPSAGWGRDFQTARASRPVRSRITNLAPSRRINLFFFNSLSKRVTVSREEPIRCAISSWVIADRRCNSSACCSARGAHDNRSLASFPEDDLANTRS